MAVDGVIGTDCYAYYNAGSYGTPTWTVIDQISDLSMAHDKETAEMRVRGQNFVFYGNGKKNVSVTFTYMREVASANDTVFDQLEDMYWSNTIEDMLFLDGEDDTTGSRGVRAHFLCDGMSEDQSGQDFISNEFSLKPVLFDDSGTKRVPQHWEAS